MQVQVQVSKSSQEQKENKTPSSRNLLKVLPADELF